MQEDYLLGKRIGDNYETEGTMGQINAVEYDCAPPSIFASRAEHQVIDDSLQLTVQIVIVIFIRLGVSRSEVPTLY